VARAFVKIKMPQYALQRILWLMRCPGLCAVKDSDVEILGVRVEWH
jgi:hypothetical protein